MSMFSCSNSFRLREAFDMLLVEAFTFTALSLEDIFSPVYLSGVSSSLI